MHQNKPKEREEASRGYTDEQLSGFFGSCEAKGSSIYDQAPEAYDAWARAHFRAPRIITERLIALDVPKDARILDFGAGSGHSGQVLHDHGYRNVVAFDISDSMLALARAREVYVDIRCDRALPDKPTELYDVIIASGVFTGATPAGEGELQGLLDHLKPGGLIALNNRVNNEHGRHICTVLFQMLAEAKLSSLHATWEDNVVDLIEHRRQILFVMRTPRSQNAE